MPVPAAPIPEGSFRREPAASDPTPLSLAELQDQIKVTFGARDKQRGVEGTYMWFMEEVGELSAALRKNDRANLAEEFADVLAWLATLANNAGIDLESAYRAKYGAGCPGCGKTPCACSIKDKP
jgi:NTP pyrophosphatase (non-canonical NTP hydrolase)